MAQDQTLRPATTEEVIRAFAKKLGVPPDLAVAVAQQESGPDFDMSAVGTKGEKGIFQLMPGTARELGVDPTDFNQNIQGGLTYLKQKLAENGGNVNKALMAYNGGQKNVIDNTVSDQAQNYADLVLRNAQHIASQRPKQVAAPAAPAAPAPAPAQPTVAGAAPGWIASAISTLMNPVSRDAEAWGKRAATAIDQRPSTPPSTFEAPSSAAGWGETLLNMGKGIYDSAIAAPYDVLEVGLQHPKETAKGFLAGVVEGAGGMTGLDLAGILAPAFGRGAKAMRGAAKTPTPAAPRPAAATPAAPRPVIGPVAPGPFQEAIPVAEGGLRGELGRLIRTDRPNIAPVVPGKPQYGTKEVPWSPPPWSTAEGFVRGAPDENMAAILSAAREVLEETDKGALVNKFDRKEAGVKALEEVPKPKPRTIQFDVPVSKVSTGRPAGRFNVVDQYDGSVRAIFNNRQKAEQWTAKHGGAIEPVTKAAYTPGFRGKPSELYKQGKPIPDPGGNLSAAEDSGRAAVAYQTRRERAAIEEQSRLARKAAADAEFAARQRAAADRVAAAAATRAAGEQAPAGTGRRPWPAQQPGPLTPGQAMETAEANLASNRVMGKYKSDVVRAIEEQADATARALEESVPPDVSRRMGAAAGQRRDVAPVGPDPAVRPPVTGTRFTDQGARAVDPGSVTAASINPALNPEAARAVAAAAGPTLPTPIPSGRTTPVPPAAAAGSNLPRRVPKKPTQAEAAEQRKVEAQQAVRQMEQQGVDRGGSVTQYPPLPADESMRQTIAPAPVEAVDLRQSIIDAVAAGRIPGITMDDIAAPDFDFGSFERAFERRSAQPAPAPRTIPTRGGAEAPPPADAPKHSAAEMGTISMDELVKRLDSPNPDISQFAKIELERRTRAAEAAPPPAPTAQFSNAPRLVKAAEKPAPVAPARPEPLDITPDPARPPDAPSVAMRPEETPQVQRVKMGETGGGPIGKPRETPTQTRTRNAPELQPGQTVAQVKAAAVDTARVPNDPTSLFKQMQRVAKTNTRNGVLTIPQKDYPKLRKKFGDNNFHLLRAPDFDKTGRVLAAIDGESLREIVRREYPGSDLPGGKAVDAAVAALDKNPAQAGPILVKARQDAVREVLEKVKPNTPPEELADQVITAVNAGKRMDPPAPIPSTMSQQAVDAIIAGEKGRQIFPREPRLAAKIDEAEAALRPGFEAQARRMKEGMSGKEWKQWVREQRMRGPSQEQLAAKAAKAQTPKPAPARPDRPGHYWDPDEGEWVPHGKPKSEAQEAFDLDLGNPARVNWEAEIGPAPKGVEPGQWKAVNAAQRLAQSQLKRGIKDARVVRVLQDFWGAEETARRLGLAPGKAGAQQVRDITQQSRKKPLSELAREADARMRHLIEDPSGFMAAEALVAGAGMAAGGLVGATLGGDKLEDALAGMLTGAVFGAAAATGGTRVLSQRGRIAKDFGKLKWSPKALAKDLPRATEAATTGNLLAGRAAIKASFGAMSSVFNSIYQRMREGRMADARRMVSALTTEAVPTYLSNLFEETRTLQKNAPQYSSHSGAVRPPSPTVLSKGAEYLTTQVLRPMIAADEAAKKVLRRGGFSEAESARKMLVGEPTSWQGQAVMNTLSSNFYFRMLVKFPRVGVSAVERAIEHTPYINRKLSTRHSRQDLSPKAPRNFREQEALSPKALKAMGEIGAASLVAGSIYGYYREPGLAEIGLTSAAFGGASSLAAAGMAAGKQFKKSKSGTAGSAVEALTAAGGAVAGSAPKLDEDNVRMFLGQFVPGASTKRMLEDFGFKDKPKPRRPNRYARP